MRENTKVELLMVVSRRSDVMKAKTAARRLRENLAYEELEDFVQFFVKGGWLEEAQGVANLLTDRGLTTEELEIILKVCLEKQQFEAALEVASHLNEPQRTERLKDLVIVCISNRCYITAGNIIKFYPTFEIMEEIRRLLVSKIEKGGKMIVIKQIADILPVPQRIEILQEGCRIERERGNAGRAAKIATFLPEPYRTQELEKNRVFLRKTGEGLPSAINSLISKADYEGAVEKACALPEPQRMEKLCIILRILTRKRDSEIIQRVIKFLSENLGTGYVEWILKPDIDGGRRSVEVLVDCFPEPQRTIVFRRILACHAYRGNFMHIERVLNLLPDAQRAETVREILAIWLEKGWFKQTRNLVSVFLGRGLSSEEIQQILMICLKKGRAGDIREVLGLLPESQRTKEVQRILALWRNEKQLKGAVTLIRLLPEPCQIKEWEETLNFYLEEGCPTEALELVKFFPESERGDVLKRISAVFAENQP